MKKELLVYLSIILIVALSWHHKQWLDHPIQHLIDLPNGGAFGIPGIVHPFIFGLIVYGILWVPRMIIGLFSKKD